jgi:hypothetical protein
LELLLDGVRLPGEERDLLPTELPLLREEERDLARALSEFWEL